MYGRWPTTPRSDRRHRRAVAPSRRSNSAYPWRRRGPAARRPEFPHPAWPPGSPGSAAGWCRCTPVADKGDTTVPVIDQMLGRHPRCTLVVHEYGVRVVLDRRPVNEDGGEPYMRVAEVGVVTRSRRDDQAGDPPVGEPADHHALVLRRVAGAGDNHEHPAIAGDLLDGAGHLRHERIRDVLDHQADGVVPADAERSGHRVGIEPELPDRRLDALGGGE